jgi:hypothetical protein
LRWRRDRFSAAPLLRSEGTQWTVLRARHISGRQRLPVSKRDKRGQQEIGERSLIRTTEDAERFVTERFAEGLSGSAPGKVR